MSTDKLANGTVTLFTSTLGATVGVAGYNWWNGNKERRLQSNLRRCKQLKNAFSSGEEDNNYSIEQKYLDRVGCSDQKLRELFEKELL